MLPIITCISSEEDKIFVEDIYEKYSKKMFAYIFKILGNHESSEDCVHEVVKRIINHLEIFRSVEGDDLIKLIMIYCRNEAFNFYRNSNLKRVREKSITMDAESMEEEAVIDDTYDPERIIISEENNRFLFKLVSELDYKYRDVLILRYYFNMGNNKIAELLCINPGAVATRISRAKKILLEKGGARLYE